MKTQDALAVAQRLREEHPQTYAFTDIETDYKKAADTIDALIAEVERLKEELAEVEATSERRLIKINEGQKCMGEWIAQHAQLNRDTAIQIAALRAENERLREGDLSQLDDDADCVEELCAEVERLRKFVVKEFPNGWGDHACAECHPTSEIIKPGFRCVPHVARAALKGTK